MPKSKSNKSQVKTSSKSRKAAVAVKPKQENIQEEETFTADDPDALGLGFDDWLQPRQLIKPDDQLELTDAELKEEFTRILDACNPNAAKNLIRFNFSEASYKQLASIEQLAFHFSMDGCVLHKESDAARRQATMHGASVTATSSIVINVDEAAEEDDETKQTSEEAETQQQPQQQQQEPRASSAKGDAPTTKIANQFNCSERAAQTYNNPFRDHGTQTEPPPRAVFKANVSQWEINDAYAVDFESQQQKTKEKPKATSGKGGDKTRRKFSAVENPGEELFRVAATARIVERMVNQNTYDEIAQDFKYWEDPMDGTSDQEGTLLPLWRFAYERTKRLAVTSLRWNPLYSDMFVVGHGSYEFTKQPRGVVCCYSLKNPSHPEQTIATSCGVTCVDIHPTLPHTIAVGRYDGGVAIYDIKERPRKPIYESSAESKHADPVWQIKWQRDDVDDNINFISVSSDGRVCLWTAVKCELACTEVIQLLIADAVSDGPDGTQLRTLGCGTTIDFHPTQTQMYLVGTEEGKIHKCLLSYSNRFLQTYDAHQMAVYGVQWNPFHPNVFISCSADWSVKIWDHTQTEPSFTFDLGSVVGDVAWAPHSSTVFAACTCDGRVHVYDLSVSKHSALCCQTVVQKKNTKLTHIAFNPVNPIILAGDDRGAVMSLKLSPNLRKVKCDKKGQRLESSPETEVAKLDKILDVVRETPKPLKDM
ncbi:PREDICTED: dynein intermediate chain 2, ciliary-like [Priapulus caudatus]|uniref:Dynein intermediate chain 2, ciliary-like n=1 Tax=Priapulus caudatus TaxID=37621 RepID=A0ABM1EV45_PRICU|nr:PREDICTED: dynein intermediate chain 2, ciliary-like [Priapulus caudatus]